MAEINLLQNDSTTRSANSGLLSRLMAKLLGLVLALAILVYAGLFIYGWMTSNNLNKVRANVQQAQKDALSSKDRNELVTRQQQLAQLETLVSNHVYWSYLLPELARVTLKSAKYTEINAKRDGSLDLTVNLPNYDEIEKYLQIFDLPEYNQQFSNVRVVGINTTQTETAIETQLRLELNFNPQYIKGRM